MNRVEELEQGIADLYVERDDLAERLCSAERELLALKIVCARMRKLHYKRRVAVGLPDPVMDAIGPQPEAISPVQEGKTPPAS